MNQTVVPDQHDRALDLENIVNRIERRCKVRIKTRKIIHGAALICVPSSFPPFQWPMAPFTVGTPLTQDGAFVHPFETIC